MSRFAWNGAYLESPRQKIVKLEGQKLQPYNMRERMDDLYELKRILRRREAHALKEWKRACAEESKRA